MTNNGTQDTEMIRPPRRAGTFVRINEKDAFSGILLGFEWRQEEIKEKVKGKEVTKKVEKPYYSFQLVKPVTLETKADNPQDFTAGTIIKVQGKGNFNSTMIDFAAMTLGKHADEVKDAQEEDLNAMAGYRFDVTRQSDGILAKGHPHAGKAVQRYDILMSRDRIVPVEEVKLILSGGVVE